MYQNKVNLTASHSFKGEGTNYYKPTTVKWSIPRLNNHMYSVSSSDIQKLVSARQQLEAQLNENKVVKEVNYNCLPLLSLTQRLHSGYCIIIIIFFGYKLISAISRDPKLSTQTSFIFFSPSLVVSEIFSCKTCFLSALWTIWDWISVLS